MKSGDMSIFSLCVNEGDRQGKVDAVSGLPFETRSGFCQISKDQNIRNPNPETQIQNQNQKPERPIPKMKSR